MPESSRTFLTLSVQHDLIGQQAKRVHARNFLSITLNFHKFGAFALLYEARVTICFTRDHSFAMAEINGEVRIPGISYRCGVLSRYPVPPIWFVRVRYALMWPSLCRSMACCHLRRMPPSIRSLSLTSAHNTHILSHGDYASSMSTLKCFRAHRRLLISRGNPRVSFYLAGT